MPIDPKPPMLQRVLLVDDDPGNIWVMAKALEGLYETRFATSGPKALELLPTFKPHLILLDMIMPEMDGFEVLSRLKADKRSADLPVIFVTADHASETRLLQSGASDFISKPISPEVLQARVALHLSLARQEEELMQLSDELQEAQAIAKVGSWRYRSDTQVLLGSQELVRLYGQPESGISCYDDLLAFVPEGDEREAASAGWHACLAGGEMDHTHRIVVGNNERWVRERAHFATNDDGVLVGVGTVQDVTELELSRQCAEDLIQTQRAILSSEVVGHFMVEHDTIRWVNQAFSNMLGWVESDMFGLPMKRLFTESAHWHSFSDSVSPAIEQGGISRIQFEFVRKDGHSIWLDLSGARLRPDSDEIVWAAVDITTQKSNELALERLSNQDGLTGLLNRRVFNNKLKEVFNLSRRNGQPFGLVMFDIDHFKRINDTFGHLVGDEVIRGLADVVKTCVRQTDLVARYGGEEFAVILPDVQKDESALVMAEKLRQRVEQAVFGEAGQVTVSLGVTLALPDDESELSLIKRADDALYEAKHNGRNRAVKK